MKRATMTAIALAWALAAACGEPERNPTLLAPSFDRGGGGHDKWSPWSEPVSLGAPVNTSSVENGAMLSKDGLSLFFVSNRPGSLGLNDIWVAHRTDREAPWGEPVNLGPPVNTSANENAPALSRDSHWLFIGTGRPGSFGSTDIWAWWRESAHDDFGWQTPVNLGSGINTTGFEGGPAYFENDDLGKAQLYYNHNDQPVNTDGDIYASAQAADGSWGPGVAVAELNSAALDQRPSVGHSGLDIYFVSNRSGSLPDQTGTPTTDIWFSTRASVLDPWSTPTNVGPPISSGLPELQPFIFSHGGTEELYFTRTVPGSGNDLFVSRRTRVGQTGVP